ncbi:hypothetical protein JCM24511_01489 [Saitozyma sp. JCM 24511]|nr:hypothetical protein JCM24511_01489 [Saitozyma sp. JCM 24511]
MNTNTSTNAVQPSIEMPYVAKQPTSWTTMSPKGVEQGESTTQREETLRLRGGCPGKLCGLPILPCACDICIIPIPCC